MDDIRGQERQDAQKEEPTIPAKNRSDVLPEPADGLPPENHDVGEWSSEPKL
jgi:hypothetical protein